MLHVNKSDSKKNKKKSYQGFDPGNFAIAMPSYLPHGHQIICIKIKVSRT
jgi:hypothetical protein